MKLDHKRNAAAAGLQAATLLGMVNQTMKLTYEDPTTEATSVEQMIDDLQRVERDLERARHQLRLSMRQEMFM